jgi:hypothetical protein
MSKTQAVLLLYYELMEGKKISMDEFCADSLISIPTFKRYIQDIRCFLSNAFINRDVVYSYKDHCYFLK